MTYTYTKWNIENILRTENPLHLLYFYINNTSIYENIIALSGNFIETGQMNHQDIRYKIIIQKVVHLVTNATPNSSFIVWKILITVKGQD